MVDFARVAATAQRLVEKNGRDILLARAGEVPVDPDRPWLGTEPGEEITVLMRGVFVPPGTVRQFGVTSLGEGTELTDLTTFSEQIVIVAQGEVDLRQFTTLIDRDDRWGILAVQVLRPANLNLLGFIAVRR